METLSWQAYEYEHRDKTPDWFWALGIIVLSVAVASVIRGNYVFALFIAVAGIVVGFFGNKKPDLARYEINDLGFVAEGYLYPYASIKSFCVEEGAKVDHLHLHIDRIIMPIMTFPLGDQDPGTIRAFLEERLPEEELRESLTHKLMEKIGF